MADGVVVELCLHQVLEGVRGAWRLGGIQLDGNFARVGLQRHFGGAGSLHVSALWNLDLLGSLALGLVLTLDGFTVWLGGASGKSCGLGSWGGFRRAGFLRHVVIVGGVGGGEPDATHQQDQHSQRCSYHAEGSGLGASIPGLDGLFQGVEVRIPARLIGQRGVLLISHGRVSDLSGCGLICIIMPHRQDTT